MAKEQTAQTSEQEVDPQTAYRQSEDGRIAWTLSDNYPITQLLKRELDDSRLQKVTKDLKPFWERIKDKKYPLSSKDELTRRIEEFKKNLKRVTGRAVQELTFFSWSGYVQRQGDRKQLRDLLWKNFSFIPLEFQGDDERMLAWSRFMDFDRHHSQHSLWFALAGSVVKMLQDRYDQQLRDSLAFDPWVSLHSFFREGISFGLAVALREQCTAKNLYGLEARAAETFDSFLARLMYKEFHVLIGTTLFYYLGFTLAKRDKTAGQIKSFLPFLLQGIPLCEKKSEGGGEWVVICA